MRTTTAEAFLRVGRRAEELCWLSHIGETEGSPLVHVESQRGPAAHATSYQANYRLPVDRATLAAYRVPAPTAGTNIRAGHSGS